MANAKWNNLEKAAPGFSDQGGGEFRRADGLAVAGRLTIVGETDGKPVFVVQVEEPPHIIEYELSEFSEWRLI